MGYTNLSGPLVVGGDGYEITLSGVNGTQLTGSATVWDDIRVASTSTKIGANSKPDFDFVNVGLLFPAGDETEKVYSNIQLPHRRKSGSMIYPHIHYVQDEAEFPVFKLDYRWHQNGSDVVSDYTTITTTGGVFEYTSGSMLQILTFPPISAPEGDTISSMLDIIIYRTTDSVIGDVLFKEFDIHIEIDSEGSALEFTKTVDEVL